jgi:hypothetical protein
MPDSKLSLKCLLISERASSPCNRHAWVRLLAKTCGSVLSILELRTERYQPADPEARHSTELSWEIITACVANGVPADPPPSRK